MRNVFALLLIAVLVSSACEAPSESTPSSAEPNPSVAPPNAEIQIRDDYTPTVTEPGIEMAWKRFTSNGRYRLARVKDMAFTPEAKRRINASFSMWQGDITFSDELVALVVDTARTDEKRFGIILFRPDKAWTHSSIYSPQWLFRDRDLSRTAIDRVSGYLFVHTFTNGEQYETCEVHWNRSAQRYVCR
jgi:hypothetical protein